jgi:hypothetical protein
MGSVCTVFTHGRVACVEACTQVGACTGVADMTVYVQQAQCMHLVYATLQAEYKEGSQICSVLATTAYTCLDETDTARLLRYSRVFGGILQLYHIKWQTSDRTAANAHLLLLAVCFVCSFSSTLSVLCDVHDRVHCYC